MGDTASKTRLGARDLAKRSNPAIVRRLWGPRYGKLGVMHEETRNLKCEATPRRGSGKVWKWFGFEG